MRMRYKQTSNRTLRRLLAYGSGMVAVLAAVAFAAAEAPPGSTAAPTPRSAFISVAAPIIAITHVRVVDGTGAPPRNDQTIVISDGKIRALGAAATTNVPANARIVDGKGRTVLPGLVGMHDHIFITSDLVPRSGILFLHEQAVSAPRLYLAAGVTTIRTTGSVEPYTDLKLKKLIDEKIGGDRDKLKSEMDKVTGDLTKTVDGKKGEADKATRDAQNQINSQKGSQQKQLEEQGKALLKRLGGGG